MRCVLLTLLWSGLAAARAQDELPLPPPGRTITLDEAYDRTLASDQSIRIAALEIRKANLQPWSALTLLGPSLNGSAGYDRSRTTFRHAGGADGATSSGESRTFGVSFSQTLLDFSVFPAYRLGKLSALAAQLQYRFTVRETLFGVAKAYYAVLKDQSIVAINAQTLELAGQQLNLAQNRYDAGDVARLDVSRGRATLEDARNTLIQSQNTLAVDRNKFGNILNLGGDTHFKLVDPPSAPILGEDFDAALANAYRQREDFRVARIAIDQDIARRNKIIGDYAPKLVLDASQNFNNSNHHANDRRAWDASLGVSLPFLTGGQREIDLITANHQIAQTRLTFSTKQKELQEEVKNAWLQVQTAQASLKALNAEVAANVQNYNDLQAQYQAGTATSLDAQAALRDLNNSRTLLAEQRYDFQTALRDLQRAQAHFQEDRIQKTK